MGDLISSEVLMRAVKEFFEEVCVYDVAPFEAVSDIESIIDSIPYVDAEPVKRGEWVQDQDGYTYCSRCEKYIPTVHRYRELQDGDLYEWDEEIEKTEYCPNCGAKMKEAMNE